MSQQPLFDCQLLEMTIERMRMFERPEGYILCFSGGKDSTVLKAVADLAGVKYEAHYHVTTVEAPPVLRYIRRVHPDVIWDKPVHRKSLAQRIADKGFPSRAGRWCCQEFKERTFPGYLLLLGLRNAEKRASGPFPMVRFCRRTRQQSINPLIDWTEADIWSFIRAYKLPYCELYDQGWKRIGCVCCPFASLRERIRNRERWPSIFKGLRHGFQKRWDTHWRDGKLGERFKNADEVFEWWLTS